MPRYPYRCDVCGAAFERVRPMSESGAPADCPNGHPGARRTFGGVVALGPTSEQPSLAELQHQHHITEHGQHHH